MHYVLLQRKQCRNKIMSKKINRKKANSIFLILTCFLIVSCVSANKILSNSASGQIKFDSEKWKNVKLYFSDDTRQRMLEDLLKKYKLIGMTREEIIALLGPESDPAYFKGWDLRYWLGREPGLGIDSLWLLLRLKDGKVIEYKIATD